MFFFFPLFFFWIAVISSVESFNTNSTFVHGRFSTPKILKPANPQVSPYLSFVVCFRFLWHVIVFKVRVFIRILYDFFYNPENSLSKSVFVNRLQIFEKNLDTTSACQLCKTFLKNPFIETYLNLLVRATLFIDLMVMVISQCFQYHVSVLAFVSSCWVFSPQGSEILIKKLFLGQNEMKKIP